jgi:ABC-type multidrug transport system fused ATPase/permease subunit
MPLSDSSRPGMKRELMSVLGFISPRRRIQLVLVFALSLLGAAAEMATLGAIIPFLAILTGGGEQCSVLSVVCGLSPAQISLGFALVIATATILRLLLVWVSTRFAYAVGADLGYEVYNRALHQPYRFHLDRNSSETIAAINRVNLLITNVLSPIMQGMVALIICIGIIAALITVDVATALIAAVSIGLFYVVVTKTTRKLLEANSRIEVEAETQRLKILQEGLGGIRDILLDGTQEMYTKRFRAATYRQRTALATNLFIRSTPRYLIEGAGMLVMVGLAWWVQSTQGLDVALPTLGALALGAQRLLPHLQTAYLAWSSLNASKSIVTDVVAFLNLPMPPQTDQTTPLPVVAKSRLEPVVTLNHVRFAYKPNGTQILRDIELVIPHGSRIGFIGKTGSGKSTLIDVIMGLLPPTNGEVRTGSAVLDDSNRRAWQSRIAHVPQSVYLTDASIAENIAFGCEPQRIDMDRVIAAAQRAQIDSYVQQLPEGYGTKVGERGVRLSGGQRQRIGLARAFYKNADVLILDEATSALDDATETQVMNAIAAIDGDITVLIIAHRLTTLRNCDVIVQLEKGQIIRQGTYAEVIGD